MAPASSRPTGQPIFTIGHSTRTLADFVALLQDARVDFLVDIRSIPRSRTNPQFNADVLPESLAAYGIGYRHIAALGGYRHRAHSESPSTNTLWRQDSFRNYADYAQTEPFRTGLAELLALAQEHRCAIMCSEAVWWRCHRRIVTDYLLARGIQVEHILGPGHRNPATMTPGAEGVPDGTLRYPAPAPVSSPSGLHSICTKEAEI